MLWLVALALAFVVGVMGLATISRLAMYRRLTAADAGTIADLKPGPSSVTGRVMPTRKTFKSPVTDKECVYSRFEILEKHRFWHPRLPEDLTSKYRFTIVLRDIQAQALPLEDGTGRCVVEAEDVDAHLYVGEHVSSGSLMHAPDNVKKLLDDKYADVMANLEITPQMIWKESIIQAGEELHVLGDCLMGPGGRPLFVKTVPPCVISDMREAELAPVLLFQAAMWGVGAVMAFASCLFAVGTALAPGH